MRRGLRKTCIWLAQGKVCCWCGDELSLDGATIEHLKPSSRGGSNDWDNLAVACFASLLRLPGVPSVLGTLRGARPERGAC